MFAVMTMAMVLMESHNSGASSALSSFESLLLLALALPQVLSNTPATKRKSDAPSATPSVSTRNSNATAVVVMGSLALMVSTKCAADCEKA